MGTEIEVKLESLCPSGAVSCSASWLPINTAPNSLNVILVTDGESVWTDQKLGWYSGVFPGSYYFNGHENWEEVTHWMPIPSLPNAPVLATADTQTPKENGQS